MLARVLFLCLLCLIAAATETGSANNCCLPKVPGFCRGYFPRFYYNGLTGKCERFIYGGCGRNRNNFKSQKLCRQECDGTECVNRCCLSEDPGPCFGSFPRYSYDKVTSQCKQFIYGGCHGNRNNFKSPQECIEACHDVRC